MGYSEDEQQTPPPFSDAPREGRMGYSLDGCLSLVKELPGCAPRGAHGLQFQPLDSGDFGLEMRPARGAWVTVKLTGRISPTSSDAPREGRMGYSRGQMP